MSYSKINYIKSRIDESIKTKRPLIFTYLKKNSVKPERRKVVFWRVYVRNDNIYADGFCLDRNAKRTFRLDRFCDVIRLDDFVPDIKEFGEELNVELNKLVLEYGSSDISSSNDTKRFDYRDTISLDDKIRKAVDFFEIAGFVLKSLFVLFLLVTILLNLMSSIFPGRWDKIFKGKNDYYSSYSPIHYEEIEGSDINYKMDKNVKIGNKYRGYTIKRYYNVYFIEELDYESLSIRDVIVKINTMEFERITGIKDRNLISFYIDADEDKNGFLSWKEIKDFQLKINRKFKYKNNDIAVRPDIFYKMGGGDCEDWALFTAGLLRFWNYEPYIGSLNYKNRFHAITLVRVKELPYKFRGYRITQSEVINDSFIPEGIYTYIDYYKVGKLTRAGGRRPKLINIFVPEKCYGKEM